MSKIRKENLSFISDNSDVDSEVVDNMFFENQIVPKWVSTKVAARILGISPNALRIKKCRGEVECKYFGNELRFNISYLQSLFSDERTNVKGV